jgi:protein involved in polysaccharide export with SLBB domain
VTRSSGVFSLSGTVRIVLATIIGLASANVAMADGYRLQPGDTVRISVYARDDLSGNFRIDDVGEIVLPLLGEVATEGKTTREMRDYLQNALKDRIGSDINLVVTIAEHRPVYVDGDVDRPGAYPYRPNMTVGKVMALAGGRHSLRTAGALVSASRELETFSLLLDSYYRDAAREARLLSEVAGHAKPWFPPDLEKAASNPRIREILDNERTLMSTRIEVDASRTASLQQETASLSAELTTIQAQKKSIELKRSLFQTQFDEIEKLAGQGVVPKSSILRLQITATSLDQEARSAEISTLRTIRALDQSRRQLADLTVARGADIAVQLQDVQNQLAQSSIRYDESRKRLAVLFSQTLPVSMLTEGSDPPLVTIERSAASEPIEADLNYRLQPGDVVRVPWPEFSLPDIPDERLPERARVENAEVERADVESVAQDGGGAEHAGGKSEGADRD